MSEAETTIPIVEEEASVHTRRVLSGRVFVETETETVEELVTAQLDSTEVDVRRVPVDRQIQTVPEIRTEGDVTIVPVIEEVLVVEKRLFLREELHITRRTATETVNVPIALRKQRATVTRSEPPENPGQEDHQP